MRAARRQVLGWGGALGATLCLPQQARAGRVVEILMTGRDDGSMVWFDPIGVVVAPGDTIRWVNLDKGNAHTATAYHPANFDRPLRIPPDAEPFDSDYLLPGESFSVTLTQKGVHDYFCVPHEHAGMVGRIVVGAPAGHWRDWKSDDLPPAVLQAFPLVERLMKERVIRRI